MELLRLGKVQERHNRVCIIGGGTSLANFDFNRLRYFDGVTIAINYSILHLPFVPTYWFTTDALSNKGVQQPLVDKLPQTKYYCAIARTSVDIKELHEVKDGVTFLERVQVGCQMAKDSKIAFIDSYAGALNLAYHFRAKQVVMLGNDSYGYGHWYDLTSPYFARPQTDEYKAEYLRIQNLFYAKAKEQFAEYGAEVVNGSANSRIEAFVKMPPEDAVNYFLDK